MQKRTEDEKERFARKAVAFSSALASAYEGEDEDGAYRPRLELDEEELTEDFQAMIFAVYDLYRTLTGDSETDLLGFTHMVNRLMVQHILRTKGAQDGESKKTVDE